LIVGIGCPSEEPGGHRPIHQADDAVPLQHQVVGDVADRRRRRARVTANGEQELVLSGSQADRRRLLLAPAEETTKSVAELEQPLVVGIRQGGHAVRRYRPGRQP